MAQIPGYLTAAQIREVVPSPKDWIINGIEEVQDAVLPAYGFTSPHRYAMLMPQLATESAHFRTLEEYASGADYENRDDLGNTQPGDGVAFKGSGEIQRTGRANTTASLGYWLETGRVLANLADANDKTPEEWSLVLRDDSRIALEDACLYWTRDWYLHQYADQPRFEDALLNISGAINTGNPNSDPSDINGLEDQYGRRDYAHRFGLAILGYDSLTAMQTDLGITADGVWGPQSEQAMWDELRVSTFGTVEDPPAPPEPEEPEEPEPYYVEVPAGTKRIVIDFT